MLKVGLRTFCGLPEAAGTSTFKEQMGKADLNGISVKNGDHAEERECEQHVQILGAAGLPDADVCEAIDVFAVRQGSRREL